MSVIPRAPAAGGHRSGPPPGFTTLVRAVEQELVAALGLAPLTLRPELARADGVWRDGPAAIETRAYRGGPLRYARFVTLSGPGLEIGNVLCFGSAEHSLPIFGADLVARRAPGAGGDDTEGWQTLVAADLSPTLPEGPARDRQLAGLARRLAPYRGELPPAGELPDWCARWFSPHAVFTRPASERGLAAAAAAVREMSAELARLAGEAMAEAKDAAPVRAGRVLAVQDEYAAAHRSDDRGLGLLGRIFGAEWAGRYVEQVLFPDASDA